MIRRPYGLDPHEPLYTLNNPFTLYFSIIFAEKYTKVLPLIFLKHIIIITIIILDEGGKTSSNSISGDVSFALPPSPF